MDTVGVVVSVTVAAVGLLLSILTFFIGRQSASKAEGREAGQILSEIGYLKRGVDDIKQEFKEQYKTYEALRERVTVVERDVKTVFTKFEELRERAK